MATIQTARTSSPMPEVTSSTAMWAGIAFSFGFTLLIWLIRPWLPQIDFLPDTGASWYYWQLPDPTVMTRATGWVFYMLHQVAIWGCIYYAQTNNIRYTKKLHNVNFWALGLNAFFIVLHLIHTAIWYDGLAQDTPVWSSQGSVILMLVMVLLMENQRRGLFFGKKVPGLKKPAGAVRHYHGYVFAWAIIYTFWFHPMENTFGHLVGFFYTFVLMVQGSLFFTRIHVNKWWMLAQETLVILHGATVAYTEALAGRQSEGLWAMFLFGFLAIFVVTQMYGLGLPRWVRLTIIALFVGGVTLYYNGQWGRLNEVIRIPVIEYLCVLVLALIIWAWFGVKNLGQRVFGGGVSAET